MNKDLLKRFFDNACTSEEREQIVAWLSDPLHREGVLQLMDEEWNGWKPSAAALEQASREADLPFSAMFREATAREKKTPGIIRPLFGLENRGMRIAVVAAACVLLLLAGTGIGYYYYGEGRPAQKEPLYYATAQTLRGQRSRVVLSDGSEVLLNADSRISFSSGASAHQVVYLEGEAFFKVPDKERHLIVKTKDLVANTRGSQFNISAFPGDSTVTVSVENGKTEISPNNEKTFPLLSLRFPGADSSRRKDSLAARPKTMPMLAIRPVMVKANESVTFDKNNKLAAAPAQLNEEELSSWKDGFIYFNHADSAGLVDKLERWFDVDVSLNTDGMPLKTLNCGFRNATLTQVLSHIGTELGLDYRIEGKHVYFTRHTK